MLKIYTINNGTAYMIRLIGRTWTWTAKEYNIAISAQEKVFSTKEDAEKWINERL